MAAKATTAWGETTVLEQVDLPQSSGDKEFTSVVQLLAGEDGARYVRFAYTTDGVARRGPVTLRGEDVARLRAGLRDRPELAAALGIPAAAKRGGGRLKLR
jgi:hypothetical protein